MIKAIKFRLYISFGLIVGCFYSSAQNECRFGPNPQYASAILHERKASLEFNLMLNGRMVKLDSEAEFVIIKRHITRAPSLDQEIYISGKQWQTALENLNKAYENTLVKFQFDPKIDTVEKPALYILLDSEANIDKLVSTENLPKNRNKINLFVVSQICSIDTKKCSINGFVSEIPFRFGGISTNHLVVKEAVLNTTDPLLKYTIAHELGHYFGLLHTFSEEFGASRPDNKNDEATGDLMGDTNPEKYNSQRGYFDEFCNVPYDNEYENIMSYHGETRSEFSSRQEQWINYVFHTYRGYLTKDYWAVANYDNNEKFNFNSCKIPAIFQLAVTEKVVYKKFRWEFPGSSAVSNINSKTPTVTYTQRGEYDFSYQILNEVTGHVEYTASGKIMVEDPLQGALPLPFKENFESSYVMADTKWLFFDSLYDCNFFNYAFFGSNGSKKSLFLKNFDAVPGANDLFRTPNVKVSGYQKLYLSFDRAFCQKVEGQLPDTLIISIETCGKTVVKKLFGAELVTTEPRSLYFRPVESQWKSTSIDLLEFVPDGSEWLNVSFLFKANGGNNLYIDNIRLFGSGSIELTAEFKRTAHTINLTWPDFADDETGYIIEKQKDAYSAWTPISRVEKDITFWSEAATEKFGVYFYRVIAENSAQLLPTEEAGVITLIDVKAPKMIQTIVEGRSVGIKWTDPNEYETGYDLYYSYTKGAPMTLAAPPLTVPEFLHRKLPSNTKVYYMVRVKERNFVSEPSDTIEALVNVYKVQSRINKVESYFDGPDPGPGNGIALDITGNSEEIIAKGFLPVDQLANGIHVLYLRARDNKGYWSSIQSSTILKVTRPDGPPAITKLEYSLNSSGNPNWIPVDIGPGIVANEGLTVPIDEPVAALPDGIHFVTVRAQDNQGYWSNYFHQSFLKITGPDGEKKVITLEYKIDKGLIIGSGTAVSLTPGTYVNASIDLPPLPNGKHTISIAAKDDGGYYSNIAMDSFVVRDQSFCEKNATVYYRSPVNNARSYFWQVNDGSGWKTIVDNDRYTGSRTQVLRLNSPPTNWYGYQYRSIANGVIEEPFTLKFSDTWTGTENDDWHNPANWCCFGVPDEYTDVIIDPTTTRKPKISASSICRSLTLKPGALLKIEDGQTLEIKGQ